MDRLWRSNSSISSRTGCPSDIVNEEDHNVEKHGASVLLCLHDAKSKNFKDNIFCMANVSLNDHACFNYYSNASCLYRKTTKERDNDKSVNNLNYVNQLRVLTVLNESFKVDLFLYTMSSCFQKTELKENISKIILLSLKETVLKEND